MEMPEGVVKRQEPRQDAGGEAGVGDSGGRVPVAVLNGISKGYQRYA